MPTAVWSVSAADLNLDGDVDIVTGHNYDSQTLWSGISIVANLGNGIFELTDSIYFYGGQNVKTGQLNLDPHPEIIFKKVNSSTEFIGIIYDNIYNDTVFINMNSYEGIDKMELGDVDGNGYNDIVFSVLGEIRW
ncbi:MAG: hypothetical protein HY958_12205 [Bacteroidia bacterium]|nr:hypothetical protein [Bacteroidia bacterium]